MSTAPWWTGIPSLEVGVACGPGRHRLRWSEGRLDAPDHPDRAGEAALADLLAEVPPCLAILVAWQEHAADPSVLTVGSRHPGDTLRIEPELLTAAPPSRRRSLLSVLALPDGLQRRLQAEVVAGLTATDPDGAVLAAATAGRLTPVVRRWAGTADVRLRSDAEGVGGARRLRGGAIEVAVGPTWLSEVWSRYLGAVDGFLVLSVHRIVEGRAEVSAQGAPGAEPARLILLGPAPWRVETRRDS